MNQSFFSFILLATIMTVPPLLHGDTHTNKVPTQTKTSTKNEPKLTVVIVIDQFAYHYFTNLSKNFKYGFKFLMDKGINYTDAHHPHGTPATATGHTALNTGTLAKDHGVICNDWVEGDNTKAGVLDFAPDAASFCNELLCPYGASAKAIMVDGLSDQVTMQSSPAKPSKVYSLSYKPRAAIGMSGKLGKPVWFDNATLNFTSSKAFFPELPEWIIKFNKQHDLTKIKNIRWPLFHHPNNNAYRFSTIHNYKFSSFKQQLANTLLPMEFIRKLPMKKLQGKYKDAEEKLLFTKLPTANQLLFDLARSCINHNLTRTGPDKLLLWISLSSLDMLGHVYGPDSLEIIDMIYHLDKQLMDFIYFAHKKAGKRKTLFVLTADHGIAPIPEVVAGKGMSLAKRIMVKPLKEEMNTAIEQEFGIANFVQHFKTNQFYVDKVQLAAQEEATQKQIMNRLKEIIAAKPGIKSVWTFDELKNTTFGSGHLENYFKYQLYEGRSGDLICMPAPYSILTKHEAGTSHRSPYDYDTHVPLIIYQDKVLEPKKISCPVWIPQVPVTLAKILGVPRPSASTFDLLPGINKR